MDKRSGIYKIINKINGKYYLGSSSNICKRWRYHKESLRKQKHHSCHLQRAWDKYGEDNFDFIIVEENVPEKELIIVEQRYLDNLSNLNSYNISFVAGKVEMTEEIKRKISQSNMGNISRIGYKASEETKKRMSAAQKSIKKPNSGHKGKILSEETKQKIRETRKKQIFSKETRQKLSNHMKEIWQKGRIVSEETKKKMSETAKKRWSNPDERRKQSNICNHIKISERTRKKMSESAKKRWELKRLNKENNL